MIGAGIVRLSAALALIAGLLGMHALVVVDPGHHAVSPQTTWSAAPVHPGVPAPVTAAPAAHGTDRPAASPTHDDGVPQHDGHRMLHLCLAVLAALLVLAVSAGFARLLGRRDVADGRAAPVTGRREPPRRPPPTSVRLARLCVLRN